MNYYLQVTLNCLDANASSVKAYISMETYVISSYYMLIKTN